MKPPRLDVAPKFGGGAVLRALGVFWGAVVLLGGGLGVALQVLGPPVVAMPHGAAPVVVAPVVVAAAPVVVAPVVVAPPPVVVVPAVVDGAVAVTVGRPGAPVAAADPALLEGSPSYQGRHLPRPGAGQRLPMRVYAAGQDPGETRPRIAILMADFGQSDQDSDEAIKGLPPAVSFAVSPYARRAERLIGSARARGHELFAVVPLEPFNYPINDPGPNALLTGGAPGQNALNLEWALSRFNGYVGVTAVLGRMHGERYANAPELYAVMLEEIARRGLMYVDPRPGGAMPRTAGMPPYRAVDLVVDGIQVRAEVEARLAQLEKIARERGMALGLADSPTPMTIDRISAWATSLPVRGMVLVPVSAVVAPVSKGN